ncbi:Epimerase domain-containing protein [Fusarium keratoplasticum]|nr:Epimerase domain-containing protein [Fusarium keratoplasticum]
MGKRVIVTGGSGVVGRWVVQSLLSHGHQVLNLDQKPLDNEAVHTIKCDVADAGQVFSALSSNFKLKEPLDAGPPSPPDAVIHLAGYPRPLLAPDSEIFRANVLGFHNIIDAACKLGVRKIILASSVTVYGVTYAQGVRHYPSFPIDETLNPTPTDPYALSKLVGETVAKSLALRFGVDIYCLRIGAVIQPHEYNDLFEDYIYNAPSWAVHGWSYTDARDLGQMVHRCLEVDGLGWQIFNATNDSITNMTPTRDFLRRLCPETPIKRELDTYEAPMSNKKIREMLGFVEEHPWKKYFTKWRQVAANDDEEKEGQQT